MPIPRRLCSLARNLSLLAPLAIAALPVSATPVTALSAGCDGSASAASPANCTSSTSEAHASEYLQYFYNGFTLSLFANGTNWTSYTQNGAFTLDDEAPVTLSIAGPSRTLVVYGNSGQTATLNAVAGTVGEVVYDFTNFSSISRYPDGGDPVTLDINSTSPTSVETWTTDEVASHDFGLSMQLSSLITEGSLFGSMSESESFQFFEADGVTPVQVLVSQTPEPGSLLLLALGAVPVCYLVARKRRTGSPVRS